MCLDLSTLSRNLDKLIIKGVIIKKHSPLDSRTQNIFLTDLGETIYNCILNDITEHFNVLYDFSTDTEDIELTIDSISKLNWLLIKNKYQNVSF